VLDNLTATPPLDLLQPGETMPLVAYLAEAPDGWTAVRGQIVSAFELAADDEYYLDAELAGIDVDIATDGGSARVLGEAQINGEHNPEVLWVLAVAYDHLGRVAGYSKWESSGDSDFYFYVYSLGPKIDWVDLLVEARP
jgi:hypothetical protein